jgi:GT2 family glycosyltransferase
MASLLKKSVGLFRQDRSDTVVLQDDADERSNPDWLAGMFMLFTKAGYQALGGFDENFFLYYEDVDICARIWKSGKKLRYCPDVSVIHDARRASHKNLRFFKWHFTSLIRFLLKHGGYKRPA